MDFISKIASQFGPLSGSRIPVSPTLSQDLQPLLDADYTIYIEIPGKGAILGIVSPHWTNSNVLVAQELGWWVEPEYRKTRLGSCLLNSFEEEAKRRGASHIIMVSLDNLNGERVGQFYQKLGYSPLERSYIKEV